MKKWQMRAKIARQERALRAIAGPFASDLAYCQRVATAALVPRRDEGDVATSDCCNRNSPDENHAPGCYNAPATFRCECGFRVAGATEYEVEWIGTEHRALIHGDERDSDDE